MKLFQSYINYVIVGINNVYAYYDLFILFRVNILLIKIYPDFVIAIKAVIIVNDNLDYCGRIDNSSHFYKFCYDIIVEKMIPKFESINYINILLCPK